MTKDMVNCHLSFGSVTRMYTHGLSKRSYGGHAMTPKDDEPKKSELFNFSRRDFLKTAGVSSLVTAVANVGETEAQTPGPQAVGPGDVPVQLVVNGKRI